MNIRMVVTDLDGTLARSDATISRNNRLMLEQLGQLGVCRVIATGRSLYSARTVLEREFPIDYLVFSCGAGILDWQNNQIINAEFLDKTVVRKITDQLLKRKVDFSVQDKIPNNHCFSYVQHNQANDDFKKRLAIYQGYTRPFDADHISDASQVIAILGEDIEQLDILKKDCEQIDTRIIRATSPLNGRSIWMEFLPPQVSKAFGIEFLCQHLHIDRQRTFGIGNDFNDIDLLEYCRHRYVVSNAPDKLKRTYPSVPSNDDDGFADIIKRSFPGI